MPHNRNKAQHLYQALAACDGFYRNPVDAEYRSDMNVVFRLPSKELEKMFIAEAADNRMVGLKGHNSVGGCRASIYNSMSYEDVRMLADFMKDFACRHR